MKEVIKGLEKWRTDRNLQSIEFNPKVEIANLLEEVAEYLRAENDYYRVDALCDISVFAINSLSMLNFDFERNMDVLFTNIHNYYGVSVLLRAIAHLENNNKYIVSSSLLHLLHISANMVSKLNYDYKDCMLETIKEISSREQDPKQAELWKKEGPTGKWMKNLNQDKSTLYKAKYESRF